MADKPQRFGGWPGRDDNDGTALQASPPADEEGVTLAGQGGLGRQGPFDRGARSAAVVEEPTLQGAGFLVERITPVPPLTTARSIWSSSCSGGLPITF